MKHHYSQINNTINYYKTTMPHTQYKRLFNSHLTRRFKVALLLELFWIKLFLLSRMIKQQPATCVIYFSVKYLLSLTSVFQFSFCKETQDKFTWIQCSPHIAWFEQNKVLTLCLSLICGPVFEYSRLEITQLSKR